MFPGRNFFGLELPREKIITYERSDNQYIFRQLMERDFQILSIWYMNVCNLQFSVSMDMAEEKNDRCILHVSQGFRSPSFLVRKGYKGQIVIHTKKKKLGKNPIPHDWCLEPQT